MTSVNAPARRVNYRSYRDELAASTERTLARRRATNYVMVALTYVAAVVAILPLVLILWHLLKQGAASVGWSFFTHMPKPAGESGGGQRAH